MAIQWFYSNTEQKLDCDLLKFIISRDNGQPKKTLPLPNTHKIRLAHWVKPWLVWSHSIEQLRIGCLQICSICPSNLENDWLYILKQFNLAVYRTTQTYQFPVIFSSHLLLDPVQNLVWIFLEWLLFGIPLLLVWLLYWMSSFYTHFPFLILSNWSHELIFLCWFLCNLNRFLLLETVHNQFVFLQSFIISAVPGVSRGNAS